MAIQSTKISPKLLRATFWGIASITPILAAIWWPDTVWLVVAFVIRSLFSIAPLVIPGILLAAWIMASGAGNSIARAFNIRMAHALLVASFVGALTPVCGVTVLPLMAGLLSAGVPLAPIMAFWLSSPITDPAMLATTAATLGTSFAIGKTLAAFFLGLFGGMVTSLFARLPWYGNALRKNSIVGSLGSASCGAALNFEPKVWKFTERRQKFAQESWSITRLILICLTPAFAAEYALNAMLQPEALTPYIGTDRWWAVPLAVIIGAPAYLDGYAALPLTRGLIEHGMSQGAAMAFLVSGGVVSIWGAMAIFPVLKLKPFVLYLTLAIAGSLAAGWVFDLVM